MRFLRLYELLIEPYLAQGRYKDGDIYLICSDGLTDMMTINEIKGILADYSIQEATSVLLSKALENGGKDNIMGLFVSSLFTNADRAMTVAPILLMPQILFSGLIFKLSGATETISWLAVCRWSMEGYGTTANLNELPLKLQQEGVQIPHEAESFFEFTSSHLLNAWGILVIYTVVFLIFARVVLSKIGKEKS